MQGIGFSVVHSLGALGALVLLAACAGRSATPPFAPESFPTAGVRQFALPGEHAFPTSVAVAGDGTVWYTDRQNSRLGRFDPEREEFTEYPTPTPRSAPYGIALAEDGRVWYTAHRTGRIGSLDSVTGRITEYALPEETSKPVFLAVHGGRVWFTSLDDDGYGWLDPATGETRIFAPPAPRTRPYAIAAGLDGSLWMSFTVTGQNRIARIDPEDGSLRLFDLPHIRSGARRLTVAADGRVWYTDFNRGGLGVLDPRTGAVREFPVARQPAAPYGLTPGPGGRIWFGDGENNLLVAFDPWSERMYTVELPTRGTVVRNMAVDVERGRIWMVLGESGALGRLDVPRLRPQPNRRAWLPQRRAGADRTRREVRP